MKRADAHDESSLRYLPALAVRCGVMALGLALWFWTQSLIGGPSISKQVL